jgi:hypothetical protein
MVAMSIRALPTIKRFFQSTAGVLSAAAGSTDLRRHQDFMIHDLTSSGRFFGR